MKLGKGGRKTMRARLFAKQNGLCCYCGSAVYLRGIEPGSFAKIRLGIRESQLKFRIGTLEHLRKQSDGGDDSADNLALACARCNSIRGEMTWLDFKSLMEPVAA